MYEYKYATVGRLEVWKVWMMGCGNCEISVKHVRVRRRDRRVHDDALGLKHELLQVWKV